MKKGFTLIELMVSISIIGILMAISFFGIQGARSASRDTKRKADLEAIANALEFYRSDNNVYPTTAGAWWGLSANGGSHTTSGANAYIPGLTPTYMQVLPTDPLGDVTGWSGYLYQSDGVQYKLLSHTNGPESFPTSTQPYYDPVRPTWAWMKCSGEPACSSW